MEGRAGLASLEHLSLQRRWMEELGGVWQA